MSSNYDKIIMTAFGLAGVKGGEFHYLGNNIVPFRIEEAINEMAWQTGQTLSENPTVTISGGAVGRAKYEFDYTKDSIEDALQSIEATKAIIRDAYVELGKAADILERVKDAAR